MKKLLQELVFYPVVLIFYLFSWQPLWVLYRYADLLFLFLYYCIGYRRQVVRRNLQHAFPRWDAQKLRHIEKQYYRRLADLIVEDIWALTASGKSISRRCRFLNPEVLDDYAAQGTDTIVVMGHTGNWEWSGLSMSYQGQHQLRALYRPLKNRRFDRFFLHFRSRLGGELVPMQQVVRAMNTPAGKPVCTTFIADQTPPPETALWTMFLNQETPFFTGYAQLAARYGQPVVMAHVTRHKRGYYHIRLEELHHSGDDLVLEFAGKLEGAILGDPPGWLWSHKRWKHRRPPGKNLILP